MKDGDKKIVKYNVDASANHCGGQSKIGLSGGDKEGLKEHLEYRQGSCHNQDEEIVVTVVIEAWGGAQQEDQRFDKHHSHKEKCHSEEESGEQYQGKVLFCLLVLLFPHVFCDDGAAACGQHNGYGHDDAGHGVHDVQGGQGVGPYKVRHEHTVYHLIEGHENQHDGGGQGELNQGTGGYFLR